MKRTKIITLIMVVTINVTLLDSNVTAKAPYRVESKRFKKIESAVKQIGSGENNIIYKKNENAYIIGYDGNGSMGYGYDKVTERVIFEPSLIGEGVDEVYVSGLLAVYTKGQDVYFCGSGFWGEFYKHWREYYKPIMYPEKLRKMWILNGTIAFGKGNDLYINGLARTAGDVDTGMQKKPKIIVKNKLTQTSHINKCL